MKTASFIAAALYAFATPALAQNMPVSTFLVKADALKAQGMMAMLSPDIGILKKEIQAAGLAARAERQAREAAGQPRLACPPEKVSMNSDELIESFRAIPVAQRPRVTVKQAMTEMVRKRYPCPK
ncbi:MAG: hypothetical protein AABY88_11545 [Pseudomonadota bacterium]